MGEASNPIFGRAICCSVNIFVTYEASARYGKPKGTVAREVVHKSSLRVDLKTIKKCSS